MYKSTQQASNFYEVYGSLYNTRPTQNTTDSENSTHHVDTDDVSVMDETDLMIEKKMEEIKALEEKIKNLKHVAQRMKKKILQHGGTSLSWKWSWSWVFMTVGTATILFGIKRHYYSRGSH